MVTPSPRKESLRPRREPMVQGFPLSYASAIAITQARELAGGKRQVRSLIRLPCMSLIREDNIFLETPCLLVSILLQA